MLINLTPDPEEIERCKAVALEHNFNYSPASSPKNNPETGIYIGMFLHFEFMELRHLLGSKDNNIYDCTYSIFAPTYHKSPYGVADSLEQIKEYYKEEIDDPVNRYVIHIDGGVFQDKENKGKGGGWRWHKWGPYIGKLEPQYEYLDDEDFGDDFECVILFSLIKIP